ncbi:MAG: hypothetical protein ABSE47_07410 [Acidimicrobiales bacterium]
MTTTTTPLPPALAAVYNAMLASVKAATSVHYVATSLETSSAATTRLHFDASIGPSAGTNTATWSASGQKGAFTIIAHGSSIYLKADANSLVTFFELIPALNAAKYAGQWISFSSTDKLYSSLRSDLTMTSVAASLAFRPSAAVTKPSVIVLRGKPSSSTSTPAGEVATAVTTISRSTKRPITQTFDASYKGDTELSSIDFSQWDAATVPGAPSSSITWVSISAAITPSTTAAG